MDGAFGAFNRLSWRIGRTAMPMTEYITIVHEVMNGVQFIAEWHPLFERDDFLHNQPDPAEGYREWMISASKRVDPFVDSVRALGSVRPDESELLSLHMALFAWSNNYAKLALNRFKMAVNFGLDPGISEKGRKDAEFHYNFVPRAEVLLANEIQKIKETRMDLYSRLELPSLYLRHWAE